MSVPASYAAMIIIWSTTPLAISWSNDSVSPVAAISLRIMLSVVLGIFIISLCSLRLSWEREALRSYAYSSISIFGAMLCVYSAAQYIPSGLISVVFALSPVISNVFSSVLLGTHEFTRLKAISFCLSFSGLGLICLDEWVFNDAGWVGLLLMVTAVLMYSFSGVMVQKLNYKTHPLCMSVGAMTLSVPMFLLAWAVIDPEPMVFDASSRSVEAIIYLAVFGSIIGFMAYFHVLKEMGAVAVAMVTLLTPVLALLLGAILNNEVITQNVQLGTFCVLLGLALYYHQEFLGLVRRAIRM